MPKGSATAYGSLDGSAPTRRDVCGFVSQVEQDLQTIRCRRTGSSFALANTYARRIADWLETMVCSGPCRHVDVHVSSTPIAP